MEFNNQISVLTPNNWNTWKHDMQVLLIHYGCWQFIIQTKPEQPDEEATYKEKLDLQLPASVKLTYSASMVDRLTDFCLKVRDEIGVSSIKVMNPPIDTRSSLFVAKPESE
ncbi:uncharacterized protein TNCV_3689241 [Trichonephila clavipes]|uniref:DUF4219 domain-containing protein n=1 Tax=Trichonephila clavipes TaxID=2585209 RepID=A0A8X6SYW6_TRICX|nr:uncharacterized protein TNCV_3689241 [Trichonephila clavipes]